MAYSQAIALGTGTPSHDEPRSAEFDPQDTLPCSPRPYCAQPAAGHRGDIAYRPIDHTRRASFPRISASGAPVPPGALLPLRSSGPGSTLPTLSTARAKLFWPMPYVISHVAAARVNGQGTGCRAPSATRINRQGVTRGDSRRAPTLKTHARNDADAHGKKPGEFTR